VLRIVAPHFDGNKLLSRIIAVVNCLLDCLNPMTETVERDQIRFPLGKAQVVALGADENFIIGAFTYRGLIVGRK